MSGGIDYMKKRTRFFRQNICVILKGGISYAT
ncbi:MAG: hypothetical protein H6Q92_343 [Nitrospirae bacterium]|nr:hypothetical protein [Nitrospirota bacterium]